MLNGPASRSPAKRSGRSRLSELLKPSPPEPRTASPKAQVVVNGNEKKVAEIEAWPLVPTTDTKTPIRSALLTKSKENGVEVVVGTSPMRPPTGGQAHKGQKSMLMLQQRRSNVAGTVPAPMPAAAPVAPVTSKHIGSEPTKETPTKDSVQSGLVRSASEMNLPDTHERGNTATSQASGASIRSAMSENGLSNMANGMELAKPQATATITKQTKVSRRQSITNRKRGRSKPPPLVTEKEEGDRLMELPIAILSPKEQVPDPFDDKPPSSISRFARRSSWIIGSRSPSPMNRQLQHKKSIESRPGSSMSQEPRYDGNTGLQKSTSATNVRQHTMHSTESLANKKSKRPLSALVSRSNSVGGGSKLDIKLPQSASLERLPVSSPLDEVPEMPKNIPKGKFQMLGTEGPRRKDELWSHFRTLDAEYQKFNSKSSSLKTHVVRSGLLPFLKNYGDHPSTKSLRAEDLDRRVNILNKWWTGLLEMLNGRNGQSVSPNDRPAILEAVSGIMTRPEWRSSLSTISGRTPSRMPVSRSVSSLESASSDFLAESVLHNVRNIFIQNLLSQMAFVVERMSMRSVPASIVNFCGKACAYAFFFCPGVAEILVRLWSPPPEAIRRVLKEAGALDLSHDSSFAVDVLSHGFPSHLQPLTVTSYPALMRYLRGKPKDNIPLSSAYIPWNGPWVGRWTGRDSDLFFMFAKTAFALIAEVLPEQTSQADLICVPCAALIQAQLVSVMDATIHRSSASQDPQEGLPPPTFDDVLGADALVQPLPPRAPNTTRIMAENRLIVLLREVLFSESFIVKPHVRKAFAQTYTNLLKATTRRVSLYDHNACFTLCDFLDEAISMLARYYKDDEDPAAWIDWPFWFDVMKKMGNTNNTLTEIRLYTFIYCLWGLFTKDESRRKELCLDWLLERDYFDRQFNHWCPMVRAYYMRLLCWRIAKEDGESNDTNILIYSTMFERLNKSWSWYLSLRGLATTTGMLAPSAAPDSPAPGRRLLIVRNDSIPVASGHPAWESLVSAASSTSQPQAYQRYSSLKPLMQAPHLEQKKKESSPEPNPAPKKGWLRRMNPFSSSPAPDITPQSPDSEDGESAIGKREDVRPGNSVSIASKSLSDVAGVRMRSRRNSLLDHQQPGAMAAAVAAAPRLSFRFSLEWAEKSTLITRDRRLFAPQLPQLAQQLVDAKFAAEGKNTEEVVEPRKPSGEEVGPARYCGRALAEWDILVKECQGFYERRRKEGVSEMKWMETPTLGVESFRRPVG